LPAGELYTREIRSSEPPEDLHWRVVAQLSPLLEPAHYKLTAQDAQRVEYSRRYIPTWLLVLASLIVMLAGVANIVGEAELAIALGGGFGAGSLLCVRRREDLTVSVQPRPGGSTAVLSGFLTGRGRMALLAFEPPLESRLPIASGHPPTAADLAGRPPVG
jgi:hypothetical protein